MANRTTIPRTADPLIGVADDFWRATALDEYTNDGFVQRVLAADDTPPPIDPLAGGAPLVPLGPVDDRFQRRLVARRSRRTFSDRAIEHRDLERLLAATGVDSSGRRVVPSAGGLRAVTTFAICRSVTGPTAGTIVRYVADRHATQAVGPVPDDDELRRVCNLDGDTMPAVIVVFVAELERLRTKYGARGDRFALLETGCAAEHIELRLADRKLAGYQLGGVRTELDRFLGLPGGTVVTTGAIACGHPA